MMGGSTDMPSGPMRKQPTWYCVCTSPSNVGSSCRHQRSPSLVGARSLKRAHSCARSDSMSMQDGAGFAPDDRKCLWLQSSSGSREITMMVNNLSELKQHQYLIFISVLQMYYPLIIFCQHPVLSYIH